ncbi:MAG: bifunctional serine/threonine-protein kinase/formylglycine-generating enzyme family protein [bacterium]
MIDHLRAQARLPERQLAIAEAALQTGGATLEQALLEAGVDAEQIVQISQMVAEAQRMDEPRSGERHASGSGGRHRAEEAPAEPSVDDLIARLMDITPRFELQGEIARGAMGRILAAWDLHLGRPVAIKVLRKTAARDLDRVRFLEEAQVTGQLAHPSVMPVYELGRLRGQVAFVMKRVEGQSLKTIIGDLRQGETQPFGRMRLLNIFHQLCMAVAFAHTRGVVHRDLKPSNVMVGDFGEVVLLDWGLCKIIREGTRSTRSTSERWRTVHGQIIGTPAYMAPEQAMGMIDQVDERTDVYGLGAILYHLVTLRPPFSGKTNREIVQRVLREAVVPLRERAPELDIDPELEAICMRCLARDQADRFPNAKALADRITAYLEAPKERPGPVDVSAHLSAGQVAVARLQSLLEDIALAQDAVETEEGRLGSTDPPERKRALWAAEDRLRALHIDYADAFGTAVAALTRTIALSPQHAVARQLLTDLFIARHETATARQDHGRAAYYRRMVAEHDDGRYAALVSGQGSVHLDISPPGARVEVVRLVESDRRLVAGPVQDRGVAPLALDRLSAGVYRITLEAPGHHPLVSPLLVQAGRSTRMRLRMLPTGSVPAGFVHIPAGTFRYGSPRSDLVGPAEHALPDFLITRAPVTVAEYLAFLDAVVQREPEEARRRVPRGFDGVAPAWRLGPEGQFRLPDGEGWRADLPVVGIRLDDARAYARWRSQREGLALRLPFEEEWEKAARGTEGRSFSWGHEWDAGYAAGPEVWRGHLPPPVGYAEADRSAYGVIDLVGGVREWTSSVEAGAGARVIVRGGSFLTGGIQGRPLWNREVLHPDRTAMDLGFRLVREL